MQIPGYQIHNVLQAYTRQLCRNRAAGSETGSGADASRQHVALTGESKRQAIIEAVTGRIVERMSSGPAANRKLLDEGSKHRNIHDCFVFATIDANNQKSTASIPLEDSGFLMKRFQALARNAPGNPGASGEKDSHEN
jgi:hypothetical protein